MPTNELDDKDKYNYSDTVYITEFFSGGTKNYGYKLSNGKTTMKCKGLNLNRYDILKQLNYEKAKKIVLGRIEPVTIHFDGIRRHGRFKLDTQTTDQTVSRFVYQKTCATSCV